MILPCKNGSPLTMKMVLTVKVYILYKFDMSTLLWFITVILLLFSVLTTGKPSFVHHIL